MHNIYLYPENITMSIQKPPLLKGGGGRKADGGIQQNSWALGYLFSGGAAGMYVSIVNCPLSIVNFY